MAVFLFVSRFPPPIGGVTVFAGRKVAFMSARGHRVIKVDLAKVYWPLVVCFSCLFRCSLSIMVNSISPAVLLPLFVMGKLHRCTVYDHNASRHFVRESFRYKIFRYLVCKAHRVMVVHRHLSEFYRQMGVSASVRSPFILPDLANADEVYGRYPSSLRFFVESGDAILVNSAWRYVTGSRGEDLYGFVDSLLLLESMRQKGVNVKMVFVFGDLIKADIPSGALARTERLVRSGDLYILSGQWELWPLLMRATVFLRTTSTDGESISVLEALSLGCPVVASDCVPRPASVLLYQYGNASSLENSVLSAIGQRNLVSNNLRLVN